MKCINWIAAIGSKVPQLMLTIFLVCGLYQVSDANHTLAQLTHIEQQHQHMYHLGVKSATHLSTNPQDRAIHALAKHYELIIFYLSTCPHCHRFLPIVKSFAALTHIHLQPYTLDGKVMPGFPQTKVPPEALVQTLFPGGAMVPALYLLDQQNAHIFTVGIGEESPLQLLTRMRDLAPKVLAFERGYR